MSAAISRGSRMFGIAGRITLLGVAAWLAAAGVGCGRTRLPTAGKASPLRIQARLAAKHPSLMNLYCCDGTACDCVDSIQVSAYEVINGLGHLRSASVTALSYGDTTFDLNLDIPSPDHYRIAVELTGYRVLPIGPTLLGTQFYGHQAIDPSLASPEPVVAVLEDAVPNPNAYFTDTNWVLYWSRVASAISYTVLDAGSANGETWTTTDTTLVAGPNSSLFRVRADFVDGVHGAYGPEFPSNFAPGLPSPLPSRTRDAADRPEYRPGDSPETRGSARRIRP